MLRTGQTAEFYDAFIAGVYAAYIVMRETGKRRAEYLGAILVRGALLQQTVAPPSGMSPMVPAEVRKQLLEVAPQVSTNHPIRRYAEQVLLPGETWEFYDVFMAGVHAAATVMEMLDSEPEATTEYLSAIVVEGALLKDQAINGN